MVYLQCRVRSAGMRLRLTVAMAAWRLRCRVVWPWFHWTCQIHSCQGRRLMRLCIVVRPTRSTRPAMRPGCTLTNFCDFVGRYMQAHPEYLDLLDARHPNHVLGG